MFLSHFPFILTLKNKLYGWYIPAKKPAIDNGSNKVIVGLNWVPKNVLIIKEPNKNNINMQNVNHTAL